MGSSSGRALMNLSIQKLYVRLNTCLLVKEIYIFALFVARWRCVNTNINCLLFVCCLIRLGLIARNRRIFTWFLSDTYDFIEFLCKFQPNIISNRRGVGTPARAHGPPAANPGRGHLDGHHPDGRGVFHPDVRGATLLAVLVAGSALRVLVAERRVYQQSGGAEVSLLL